MQPRPMVEATMCEMVNAIILRAVQDFKGKALNPREYKNDSKLKLKNEAFSFLISSYCRYMCECIGINYTGILDNLNIERRYMSEL